MLAGAGTGKTRVVTHRIANLIRHGTAPERILAVTFTRKAAGEMQERAGALLRGGKRRAARKAARPQISTFHSLCVKVLRRHIEQLGYTTRFGICTRSDQESIARQALREIRVPDESLRPGDLLAIVSDWKNRSLTVGQAASVAATDREHLAAAAFRRYQEKLRTRNLVDFDDLLLLTEQLLEKDAAIRREEAGRFDHILVDEYQDANGSQYRIVKALAAGHRNLCVVGDDDQSIYAWRGADVTHILRFARDWPEAKIVRLEENYRSTGAILTYANTLIRFNAKRHDKRLAPARGMGARPQILQLQTETEEAETIVADIARHLQTEGPRAGDFAILCRTNEQPRLFETELRRLKLPYVLLGGQSFYDRKEICDLLAYLKTIDDPADEMSLLRIFNTPPRGIGPATVKTLIEAAVSAGSSVWDVWRQDRPPLPAAATNAVKKFFDLLADLRDQQTRQKLPQFVDGVLRQTGYERELDRLYPDPNDREARRASLEELINAAGNFAENSPQATLRDFLDETALGGETPGNDKEKELQRNAVALLTLHAAKGLEFPYVYMVGMEEGILPHKRSLEASDNNAIDEERRLCYVGVTRAQERLTLSLALTRRKWGKPRETTPSRFLYEMTGQADNPHAGRGPTRKQATTRRSRR